MRNAIGISLLLIGVILLIYGFSSCDSLGASFSKLFTGKPTDHSLSLIAGGAAAVIVGGALALSRRNGGAAG